MIKTKLNCILLIDDREETNFINSLIIRKAQCTDTIEVVTNGVDALNYLTNENNSTPDLILLDINMPTMDGFEFMEEYVKLEEAQKAKIVIVMLTSSLNPDDMERAKKTDGIDDFRSKPLDGEELMELLKKHFPDNF